MEVHHELIPYLAFVALAISALPYRASAEPGNAAHGERMYRACVACHSLEPNRNKTGPRLAEIWNRAAGSLPSFPRYSPALRPASSGPTTRSTNGSRIRSTSFPATP
jgi:cytochrome c